MEEELKRILLLIGVNKNAVEIYLDLIKHGTSSALDISKRTRIHRSNTYDALRELVERGFISEVLEEKRKLFKAGEPEKIRDFIKNRELELDSIIPGLKEFSSQDKKEDEISVSKGVFAVREALREMLRQGEEIKVFGASKKAYESLGEWFLKDFHKERIKNKVVMRHIYDEGALDRIQKLNKMKFTEAKYVSHKYFSVVSTNICGDTVYILIFGEPMLAVKIKNKDVAESYKNYFEFMWKDAKKLAVSGS